MNCCYITDFCKSKVNFVFYYICYRYKNINEFQKFQISRSWILKKMVMGSHGKDTEF
jgi:hypothetical protein